MSAQPGRSRSRSLPFPRGLLVVPLFVLLACAPADEAPPEPVAEDPAAAEASDDAAKSDDGESTGAPRTPPPELEKGIDLSSHSGAVDWNVLSQSDFDFVFLKATEGVDLADPAFGRHWESAVDTGMVRGAYHFYVTEDDPKEQARFFIGRAPLGPGDLAPVVDVELIGHGTQSGWQEDLGVFLDELESHYGVEPIIYTSPNFWDQHLDHRFGDHPLWVAEYGVEEPRVPEGWQRWTLWQYVDDHDVPGVEKDADVSRVHPQSDVSSLIIPHPEP